MNEKDSLEILQIENFIKKFSVVENYGEYLTKKDFITNPAIGRDDEINQMILTLLTPCLFYVIIQSDESLSRLPMMLIF